MEHLEIYEKVRSVPAEAKREIKGGRLNGKTDINPMWRIKKLTELFGVCGIGWKYEITDKRLERGGKDEIAAFVDIKLYVKVGDVWSEGIVGTGGSSFVSNDRNGLYTSDECFKMALTDAISVSCKALGVGADVYWNGDTTKYDGKGDVANAGASVGVGAGARVGVGASISPPSATKITEATMATVNELEIDLRKTARANGVAVEELTEEQVLKAIAMKKAYLANEGETK